MDSQWAEDTWNGTGDIKEPSKGMPYMESYLKDVNYNLNAKFLDLLTIWGIILLVRSQHTWSVTSDILPFLRQLIDGQSRT